MPIIALFHEISDEMITIASAFEKKDELYVETMAYKELKTIIEDRYWATLLGKAGDGKSATAAHLLLHYKRQGYRPVFLSSARKWEEMLNSGKLSGKTFVMIDDMFGSIHIDNKKVEDWLSVIEIMEKIVKERDGELLIVCTSRRHVFTDVESKLYRCCCFTKTSAVDMTDEEFRLSSNEKSAILRKFVDTYDVNVDEEMLEMIKDVDPPHGFPHCVEMFFTNVFLRESGVSFFQNPEEFVKQELNNFKDNDPLKFLVLLLVLYKQNRVHPSYFGKVQGNADKEVVELFKSTGIPQSTAYSHMLKAVDSLTNTYLTQGSDGYYSFTHESLKENVSEVYISLSPLHATELLNLQQIITYMNKPKSKLKTSLTCNLSANVKLPENKLIEKVTTELLISSDVSTVIKCAVWFDQAFVDEWIKFITMPCESESIPACLSEYLLRKIVFPDIQRYDKTLLQGGFDSGFTLRSLNLSRPNIDCFTLVTSLLKNNMTCAAIAILRNKCIQEVLGQDIKWHRSLKKGLEIVCSKTCDTGVIKAILASQDEINSRRLNGSNALMYALQSSNAECASHLLENTRIMFDKGNNETYFRHILNSNIDLSNFKQLCDLLIAAGADITENKNGIPLLHTCFVIAKADICIKNLEYLLELTSNIDVRSSKNSTNIVAVVLEKLTVKQCLSILPILKERNADFHHVNQRDMNALHIICQKQPLSQYLEVVQYLIKIGVNIAQRSNDGAVPLMFACQNDPGIECLKQLLKGSPQDHTNKLGQGYIHYLLQSNCMLASLEKYFRVLLVANANINLQDKSGRTAAMLLLQNSLEHRKCAKELIAFMDLLNSSGMEFHLTDAGGRNVLHYVFGYRHVNQPSRLQRSSVSTPLVSKTRIPVYNQTDSSVLSAVFEYLVETIKVDCFLADVNGVNPLMLALLNYPNSVAVTTLINRNVPDQKDKTGATYFHYLADSRAVSRERLNSIESTLMSQGLDLDTSVLKIPFDGLSHRKKQRVLPVL